MFCYLHPCFFRAFGRSVDGAAQKIYNSCDLASMPHPGLGDWSSRGETCCCSYGALVERADRDHRVDRMAPNGSSVAQLRAELWPETRVGRYGALVERADRDRRVDRVAPNESSVAYGPKRVLVLMCIQNVEVASMVFAELWMTIRVCIKGLDD